MSSNSGGGVSKAGLKCFSSATQEDFGRGGPVDVGRVCVYLRGTCCRTDEAWSPHGPTRAQRSAMMWTFLPGPSWSQGVWDPAGPGGVWDPTGPGGSGT